MIDVPGNQSQRTVSVFALAVRRRSGSPARAAVRVAGADLVRCTPSSRLRHPPLHLSAQAQKLAKITGDHREGAHELACNERPHARRGRMES